MKQMLVVKTVLNLALVSAIGLTAACSSSSDSSVAPVAPSLSGSVVAAPVNGATVLIKDTTGNTLAGPATTGSDGGYNIDLSSALTGTFIVESSGGTYDDEATGANTAAGSLNAYVDSASLLADSQVHATPATSIVHNMVVNHGMTLSAAQAAFESAFGFAADATVAPADATSPATDATEEELLAGLRAAAFSQLTDDLGLAPAEQFDLLTALAEDLADGALDGEANGAAVDITPTAMLPVDIQNRFVTALLNFHNDGLTGMMSDPASGNDMTGLDNSQIGMLPFAKVALTGLTAGAYKMEYIPGMMDAMQGKTEFTLRISDDSGNPVTGSMVMTMFVMNMEDRRHSTADVDCEESIVTAGDYECTVYYVMPSVMATGDSMGFWQVKATVDSSQTAIFYPMVNMAMGDTTRVLLKGDLAVDSISMMGSPVSRPYNLFRNDLSGATGNHDFELFIAPMETMMSFPALATGLTLNTTFLVSDVKVEFSTDETNWFEATYVGANGSGIWGITGLAGLTDGVEGKIYVRLYVDSNGTSGFQDEELKTTDGLAADGTNEYAAFRVTP